MFENKVKISLSFSLLVGYSGYTNRWYSLHSVETQRDKTDEVVSESQHALKAV